MSSFGALGEMQAQLLRILIRFQVEMVVVGGVAAQLHGWEGATTDLDVAVSVEGDNVARLNAALGVAGAHGQPMIGAFGTIFNTVYGRLEVIRRADGIGEYADWLRNSREMSALDGLTIVVAAPGDIIRSKEAAGRSKDLAVLPQMKRDFIDHGHLSKEDVSGEVAGRNRTAVQPPAFLVDILGPRPAERPGRWEIAAQAVHHYLDRWNVEGPGLGDVPSSPAQASDHSRVEALIERLRRP